MDFKNKLKAKLLNQFNPEIFNKLSEKEQKELISKLILNIQEEKGLTPVNITFLSDGGFTYNLHKRTLNIEIDGEEAYGPRSYTILNGIIHELRHQEQFEKMNMENEFSREFYAIVKPELDAHNYTSEEMHSLKSFFNTEDFDRFVAMMDDLTQSIRLKLVRQLEFFGYTEKLPEEYKDDFINYCNENEITSFDYQKSFFIENGIFTVLMDSNNQKMCLEYNDQRSGIIVMMNLSNEVANVTSIYHEFSRNINGISLQTKELERIFNNIIDIINICNNEFCCDIQKISFAPIIPVLEKDIYEKILSYLNVQPTELFNINDLNLKFPNEKIEFKNFKREFACFGNDFELNFDEEQKKILKEVAKYVYPLMGEEVYNKELFLSDYKQKYSAEKLELIFKSQKLGLNTGFYAPFSEEQIKKIQKIQLRNLQIGKSNDSIDNIILDAGLATEIDKIKKIGYISQEER